jgi:hypothetical protein
VKIYIGRTINKSVEELHKRGSDRYQIGAFVRKCEAFVGKGKSTLNEWRFGRIYSVLLSKMNKPPIIEDIDWFKNFPNFSNAQNEADEIWDFYLKASEQATKVPTKSDLIDTQKQLGRFFLLII